MSKYIITFDQGTTSSRCIIFNKDSEIISKVQKEIRLIYPKTSWVEQDPMEILDTQITVANEAIKKANIKVDDIVALGITNQRETTIIWDRRTGKPVYNAIVWQCRRSAGICDDLIKRNLQSCIKEKTGLVIDAYFSGTKIKWILDNIEGIRTRAENGELFFGTVDTWLIWNLTKGKIHATDFSNASRTMLFNIKELNWDNDILKELDIPKCILPKVKPTSYIYGNTDKSFFGKEIEISGICGDQQAALFGQKCFDLGEAKNTYGTGGFMLLNIGKQPIISDRGILTSIAWGIDGIVEYALEGSVFVSGAAIQWLRDELKLIDNIRISEDYATSVSDNNGVYFVPALTGLGTPHWDYYVRGSIFGLTRGTKKEHIVRAAIEAAAYQTYDIMNVMLQESNFEMKALKVDGGSCVSDFLMQFQADILNIPVLRAYSMESTALGAAYLAGLSVGFWKNRKELSENISKVDIFKPKMSINKRNELIEKWSRVVEITKMLKYK
jgi:glycerol kinase